MASSTTDNVLLAFAAIVFALYLVWKLRPAMGVDDALELRRRADNTLASSLGEGQRLGIVREGDPKLYASMTIGAIREVLVETRQKTGSKRTREQVVEAFFAVLEGGYLRLKSDPKGPKRRVYATIGPAPSKRRKAPATRE